MVRDGRDGRNERPTRGVEGADCGRWVTRRRLLGLATAGVATLAGCGGTSAQNRETDDDTETDEDTATAGDDTASLGYVRVVNRHEAAHTLHVLVERGDDVTLWSSYDLGAATDAASVARVDGPWTEEQADYTVHFRVDDQTEWRTFSTAATELDCYGLEARVSADGGLGVWVEHSPDECRASTSTET
jgi:hypothetical protein